jgi:Ring finger domain
LPTSESLPAGFTTRYFRHLLPPCISGTTHDDGEENPLLRVCRAASLPSRFTPALLLPATTTMFTRHRRTSSLHQVQDGQSIHYRARDATASSAFAGALRSVSIVGGQVQTQQQQPPPPPDSTQSSSNSNSTTTGAVGDGGDDYDDDRCSICLGRFFTSNDPVTKVQSCGHPFHDACIRNWLQRQAQAPSCPSCRADVPTMPTPTSPSGTMTIQLLGTDVCPGYDANTTCLELIYSVPTGLQHSVRHASSQIYFVLFSFARRDARIDATSLTSTSLFSSRSVPRQPWSAVSRYDATRVPARQRRRPEPPEAAQGGLRAGPHLRRGHVPHQRVARPGRLDSGLRPQDVPARRAVRIPGPQLPPNVQRAVGCRRHPGGCNAASQPALSERRGRHL